MDETETIGTSPGNGQTKWMVIGQKVRVEEGGGRK
jgi:hypothetical protein